MNSHSYESQLPALTLPQNELALLIKTLLAQKTGSISIGGFANELGSYFARTKTGFHVAQNTDYRGNLDERDVTRVREIIWDLVISRCLTPGAFGDNSCAQFTITERGHAYLAQYKP